MSWFRFELSRTYRRCGLDHFRVSGFRFSVRRLACCSDLAPKTYDVSSVPDCGYEA